MPRPKRQKTNDTMAHAWTNLPSQLESAIPKANQDANNDENLKYFAHSNAITESTTFGIKSAGSDEAILTTVTNGKVEIRTGNSKDGVFSLVALPEQWQEFFKQTPKMPYQSFWGKTVYSVMQTFKIADIQLQACLAWYASMSRAHI